MTMRKTFEQEVGIDTGETRPSTWDTFHEMAAARMEASVAASVELTNSITVKHIRMRRSRDNWMIVAALGWGMFAIACLSRL